MHLDPSVNHFEVWYIYTTKQVRFFTYREKVGPWLTTSCASEHLFAPHRGYPFLLSSCLEHVFLKLCAHKIRRLCDFLERFFLGVGGFFSLCAYSNDASNWSLVSLSLVVNKTWKTYHTMVNHSKKVATRGNQLDYIGIVILMWGSTISTMYLGFCCDPRLQKIYWLLVRYSVLCPRKSITKTFRGCITKSTGHCTSCSLHGKYRR